MDDRIFFRYFHSYYLQNVVEIIKAYFDGLKEMTVTVVFVAMFVWRPTGEGINEGTSEGIDRGVNEGINQPREGEEMKCR